MSIKRLLTRLQAMSVVAAVVATIPFSAICLADVSNPDSTTDISSVDGEDESDDTAEVVDPNTTGVNGFVNRLYQVALGRQADAQGFREWGDQLREGNITGAQAAEGFLLSDEFTAHNYPDTQFVTYLYKVFFDREPDQAGLNAWVAELAKGQSRRDTLAGFVNSTEWANVCLSYGIISGGTGTATYVPKVNQGITTFVTSLYSDCLSRNPDSTGLDEWSQSLAAMRISGKEAAYGFFYSDEFQNKAKTMEDEELIGIFYKVFLNREADEYGLYSWMKVIEYGGGFGDLFHGFSESTEFRRKCISYGILPGEEIEVECTGMDQELMETLEYEFGDGIRRMEAMTTPLNPHRDYQSLNVQGSEAVVTNQHISDKDWAILQEFEKEYFRPTWTPAQKAAFTMYWINRNVTYASTGALWGSISGQGPAQAIFETRVGQCAQYNGALCEMLCYLGYDARMIQGYRSSRSGNYSQHFWCEVNIDGEYYCMECGNYGHDGPWYFFCEAYYPDGRATRFVKNS